MGIGEYLARRVCERAHDSVGMGSFGKGIFEYNPSIGDEVRIWGGVLVKFVREGNLVKILMEGCEKDKVIGLWDREDRDTFSREVLEYVTPGREKEVVFEAKLRDTGDGSSDDYKEKVFQEIYESTMIPIFSVAWSRKESA